MITVLTDKAASIQWAKDAIKARIDKAGYVIFEMKEPGINGEYYYDDQKPLEGKWKILGKSSELTEDQWREVVEKIMPFGRVERWKDYEFTESGFYTAIESGQSLLKSKNLEPETTLILIKQ